VHPALKRIAHRPWRLPSGPWIMAQTWHDLLFAHWPVQSAVLRRVVPQALTLDTFEGKCWIAVTPFHMSGVHFRGLPPFPGISRFPELNVRTYVTLDGKPGVYFFSLDATSAPAVWGARTFYHLPYFVSEMSVEAREQWIRYLCQRKGSNVEFHGRYRPIAAVQLRQEGTLESWLTERYCLYSVARGRLYRAEIHHEQWPLQNAEAEIEINTMAASAGIALLGRPSLLHFSRKLEVLVWPPHRVRSA
jgi:uncharacterized protein YqjF (DUF2071 family)